MNKFIPAIGAALVIGAFAVTAQAAEPIKLASLADVNGKVMVNKGKGYVSAKSGTALDAGDRVISLDGSKASVVFADGCVTKLKENNLLSVDAAAGCGKQPVVTGAASQPLRYAAVGGGETVVDAGTVTGGGTVPGATVAGATAAGATLTTGLIITGVVVGGIVVSNANKNDNPISPQ